MATAQDPVLVHDYLLVMRGAERTFAAMAECWPQAPVYTLLYDAEGTWQRFGRHRISTSRLQRLGLTQDGFRRLLPLYPLAAERLPVPATTWSSPPAAPSRTASGPTRARCTSATATRRSATPGTSARPRCARCPAPPARR